MQHPPPLSRQTLEYIKTPTTMEVFLFSYKLCNQHAVYISLSGAGALSRPRPWLSLPAGLDPAKLQLLQHV